jgi:hypothetical protein
MTVAPFNREEFEKRWRVEHAEWVAICDEMVCANGEALAFDVSEEQRRRMASRGEESVLREVGL